MNITETKQTGFGFLSNIPHYYSLDVDLKVQWNPVIPITNWPQKSGRINGVVVRRGSTAWFRVHKVTGDGLVSLAAVFSLVTQKRLRGRLGTD